MNKSSLHWNGAAYNCNMKLRRKSPGSIRCHDLHSLKEGVILLCQSIYETRQISYLHGSALFTISWNVSFRILTSYPSCKQFTLSICLRIYLLLAFALNMLFKVNFSFSMLRCFMLILMKFAFWSCQKTFQTATKYLRKFLILSDACDNLLPKVP